MQVLLLLLALNTLIGAKIMIQQAGVASLSEDDIGMIFCKFCLEQNK